MLRNAIVGAAVLSVLVCSARGWPVYGGSSANIKYSALSQINRANVRNLQVAWRYSSTQASGTNTTDMKTNPLIVDGTLYGLNPQLKVFALDAATGREKWVYDPVTVPQKGKNIGRGDFAASTKISRGLAFYRGSPTDQRIIYAPGGGHALYCVDALTGKLIPSFGDNGIVDMHDDLDWTPPSTNLPNMANVHDFHYSMTSPGIIYKDLIIVGSRLSEGPLTPPGHIRAYDVHTGKRRWIFHTVPQPGEAGYETYENKDAYKWVGGANAWGGFSLDEKRGIVFTGTGSTTPDFWGGNRKGNDLYGDSTLALDAATGKLIWHFQEVHHDLWDWDNPTAPILASITKDGKQIDVAVQTTKQGFIFMFDRVTGKPIHPIVEIPVPQTKLKGEYTSPTQPVPTFFKPFIRQTITEADLFKEGISEESYQDLLQRFRALDHDNMWNPPSERGTVQMPGFNGGGEWGGPAFDPETSIMYINGNESPWVIGPRTAGEERGTRPRQSNQTNLEVGKSLYQKQCAHCHGVDRMGGRTYPSLVGLHLDEAAFASLIFTGKGTMPPFGSLSAAERIAIASYVLDLKTRQKEMFVSSTDRELPDYYKIPYREGRGGKFLTKEGYPGVKPPWGHLTAVELNTGRVVWKTTIGDYPELKAKGIHAGSENFGAPVVTAGGLVFIVATRDEKIRAFDKMTGELLWEADLPAAGIATPAVYEVNGKEYVVIACGGGGKQRTKSGDEYVAFALPDKKTPLRAEQDEKSQTINVYRSGGKEPILTQNARQDARPYLHPIVAPDGHGVITEYRPSHHPHQTGIYWGFKILNGREFFMQWQGDHYRKVSAAVVQSRGEQVKWQTVYDMLDESGAAILTETQNWSMEEAGGKYVLDLEWRGEAKAAVTLGKAFVGGLFVRIPWRPEDRAEAVNAAGQRDNDAEQQRAAWTDVGIQVNGRNDLAHIAVFDHPDNAGFPTPWRVDQQYGFGPNTEWTETKLDKGKGIVFRYRLIAYCGDLRPAEMVSAWKEFGKQ